MIRRVALLGVLFVLGLQTSLWGDVINVPDDQPSIQAAIDAAADGDEIIVAPGTYLENINLLGKAVTLRSSAGPDVTTIDAGGNGTVVTCQNGEGPDTLIDGFAITGGNATDDFPDNRGGGMRNEESSPTVTNCIFTGNSAAFGGGMYNADESNPTVIHCTFVGNTAEGGGGMFNKISNPTVINCTFSGNTATSSGGGMVNVFALATVTNCTFSGNTATSSSGGMFNFGSNPTVTNCTFSGNTTTGAGGAMNNTFSSSPTITNCTFSGNSASSGGGMRISYGDDPVVTNCILWNNIPDEIAGPGMPTVTYSDVQGGWPGEGNIDADPLFVDADGPDDIPGTEDDLLRLSSRSPAIDAADNTAVPEGVVTDLDGNPRFVDDPDTPDTGNPDGTNHIVDMGAYEFGPPDPCEDDDGDGRVTICHIPPGNPDNAHTITVSVDALPAHLAHGDHCGACEEDDGLLMGGSSNVIPETVSNGPGRLRRYRR